MILWMVRDLNSSVSVICHTYKLKRLEAGQTETVRTLLFLKWTETGTGHFCQWNKGVVITKLLKGHSHLKGHLFKLLLTNSPICERCLEEDESATHSLCDVEAIAYLRFHHLGHYFMEPGDCCNASVRKVLCFNRRTKLTNERTRREGTIDLVGRSTRAGTMWAHHLYSYT
jgi:hypothetical protein